MNSAVIIKIEIKPEGASGFEEINLTGFTGNLVKVAVRTRAGNHYSTTIRLKVPKCNEETGQLLDGWLGRKAEIKATDANDMIHHVGDTRYPARLTYEQSLEGSPGGWNGYDVTITHNSPISYTISETP